MRHRQAHLPWAYARPECSQHERWAEFTRHCAPYKPYKKSDSAQSTHPDRSFRAAGWFVTSASVACPPVCACPGHRAALRPSSHTPTGVRPRSVCGITKFCAPVRIEFRPDKCPRSHTRARLVARLLPLVSACAAPTQISSNKAQDYTAQPTRLFVVTDVGSDFR
jgi:hypothetical protein